MFLELKSFFKNKIIKILFIVSILIALNSVYNIELRFGGSYILQSERLREDYMSHKTHYEEEKLRIERDTPLEYKYLAEEMIKSMDWKIEATKKLSELYLDGYRKNEKEILELVTYIELYYMQRYTDYNDGYKYPTEIFKEEIEKYLDLEKLPFDLYAFEELHNVVWGQVRKEEKGDWHTFYTIQKKRLERKFYLLENNLKEVDSESTSPWNYLAYTYSYNTSKSILFIPLVILMSTYIIILSRGEKSIDLIKLRPLKKSNIYFHYLKIALIISIIILIIPDILSVIFMGIKNGFYGLRNPIEIYKEGLITFKTYDHIGKLTETRGLSKIYGVGFYKDGYAYGFQGMENIEFYKFLFLSSIPSILKLVFFVTLGISIGLLIKNKGISIVTSSLLTLFTILSRESGFLRKNFNIFAISTGWDTTLGHTEFSWLGSIIALSISIVLLIFASLSILKKQSLD